MRPGVLVIALSVLLQIGALATLYFTPDPNAVRVERLDHMCRYLLDAAKSEMAVMNSTWTTHPDISDGSRGQYEAAKTDVGNDLKAMKVAYASQPADVEAIDKIEKISEIADRTVRSMDESMNEKDHSRQNVGRMAVMMTSMLQLNKCSNGALKLSLDLFDHAGTTSGGSQKPLLPMALSGCSILLAVIGLVLVGRDHSMRTTSS